MFHTPMFYAPSIPIIRSFKLKGKCVDVSTTWYTITTVDPQIITWLLELPIGSYRSSNLYEFDLSEEVYNWFLLRWA